MKLISQDCINDSKFYEKVQNISNTINSKYKLLNIHFPFPYTIYIGLFPILWLIFFGLIYPVYLMPQSSLEFLYTYFFISTLCITTTTFLKITFFFGLFILVAYLFIEIYNVSSDDSINKRIIKLFKIKLIHDDPIEESEQKLTNNNNKEELNKKNDLQT